MSTASGNGQPLAEKKVESLMTPRNQEEPKESDDLEVVFVGCHTNDVLRKQLRKQKMATRNAQLLHEEDSKLLKDFKKKIFEANKKVTEMQAMLEEANKKLDEKNRQVIDSESKATENEKKLVEANQKIEETEGKLRSETLKRHRAEENQGISKECGICLADYNETEVVPRVLKCGHTFCIKCIRVNYSRSRNRFLDCPYCRRRQYIRDLTTLPKNFALLE